MINQGIHITNIEFTGEYVNAVSSPVTVPQGNDIISVLQWAVANNQSPQSSLDHWSHVVPLLTSEEADTAFKYLKYYHYPPISDDSSKIPGDLFYNWNKLINSTKYKYADYYNDDLLRQGLKEDYEPIQTKLGPDRAYSDFSWGWYNDPDYLQPVRAVLDVYQRRLPEPVRFNSNNSINWATKQNDDYIYFGAAVEYFKKWNIKSVYTQKDCNYLEDMGPLLDQELSNIAQNRVYNNITGVKANFSVRVINDIKDYLLNWQIKLNCKDYLSQEEADTQLKNELVQKDQIDYRDQQNAKTTNYFIYSMIGVVVLLGGIIIIKRL